MPNERPDIFETTRYGFEATSGTGVKANRVLLGLGLSPTPQEPLSGVQARGYKADVGTVSQKGAHTTADVSGNIAVNDLIVALTMCLCQPVVTTPSGATLTKRYTFTPVANGPDNFKTATVDNGSSAGASRFAYAALQSLLLTFSLSECTFGGNAMGQRLAESGVTLETTLTEVPLVPISPDAWNVYVADTVGGLTTGAKLDRAFEFMLSIGDRFGPVFTGDTAVPSYAALAEKRNTINAALTVEQTAFSDQTAMNALRAKSLKIARFVAVGSLIETVTSVNWLHRIQITLPFNFRNPRRGVTQDVRQGEYDLTAIYNGTFGSFLEIVIDTATASTALISNGTVLDSGQDPNALNPGPNTATPITP